MDEADEAAARNAGQVESENKSRIPDLGADDHCWAACSKGDRNSEYLDWQTNERRCTFQNLLRFRHQKAVRWGDRLTVKTCRSESAASGHQAVSSLLQPPLVPRRKRFGLSNEPCFTFRKHRQRGLFLRFESEECQKEEPETTDGLEETKHGHQSAAYTLAQWTRVSRNPKRQIGKPPESVAD